MLRTTELVSVMRNESTDKKSRVSNGPLRQIFAKFLTLIPPFTFTIQAGTDVQYLTEYFTPISCDSIPLLSKRKQPLLSDLFLSSWQTHTKSHLNVLNSHICEILLISLKILLVNLASGE